LTKLNATVRYNFCISGHHFDNKEPAMTDNDQPQDLKSWSNVGAPGAAPATPFIPTEAQKQKFKPINMSKTIAVHWKLDSGAYENLRLGHSAHEMEDKWNVYMQDNTVLLHRSWTGLEVFRFTVQPADDGTYMIDQFEVEQDPGRYTVTDESAIYDALREVLQAVLGVKPMESAK
jgi:hypothetical protein